MLTNLQFFATINQLPGRQVCERFINRKKQAAVIIFSSLMVIGILNTTLLAAPAQAATGINSQISFQGKLVNTNGTNIADGTYNLRFKIYQDGNDQGVGSTLKWTETRLVSASQGVVVSAGTFQVNLGSVTPFASNVDWNQDTLWLSMEVGGTTTTPAYDGEMKPYIRLTAVPYAQNANTLDGIDSTSFAQLGTSNAFTGATNSISGVTNAAKFSVGSMFNVDTANSRVSVGGAAINYSRTGSGGTLNIASPASFTTGTGPGNIALDDLDGDGDKDMAVADQTSDQLSILINTGGTNFSTKVDYVTDDLPRGVDSADVDADGDRDVIVAVYNTSEISVFKNNGNGTFATKVDYATGTLPNNLDIADVDGDGDQDVVTSNESTDNISVLKNTGTGTFATKVDYVAGDAPDGVALADYDGDGDKDIAVSNQAGLTVSIYVNNGTGTFATKVDYANLYNPNDIVSADFDGDGDFDLATAGSGMGSNVAVFKNNGNATFASATYYSSASNARESIESADVDGDGDKDLATAGSTNGLTIFLNSGTGAFDSGTQYTAGSGAFYLAFADLDGDGEAADIAVTDSVSNAVLVFRNNTAVVASENSTATASVTTSSATSGGLFIKGVAGQTASYFGILNSTGTRLFSVDVTGRLETSGDVSLGGGIFLVDSGGNQVKIGTSLPDAVGTVLILDNKNTSGDPTGSSATRGAMYYNSNLAKFRCFEGFQWKDCITPSPPLYKAAFDFTNNTTAASNVSGLTWPVAANTDYVFSCTIIASSAATTTGIQMAVNGPATPTQVTTYINIPITATSTPVPSTQTAFETYQANTAAVTTRVVGKIKGVARIGATAGTMAIRLKSEVATSTVTVHRGSFCSVR